MKNMGNTLGGGGGGVLYAVVCLEKCMFVWLLLYLYKQKYKCFVYKDFHVIDHHIRQ